MDLAGSNYVLHQQNINIKPNTLYKVRAKLNKPVNFAKGYVDFDFYGEEHYDKADQKLNLLSGNILEGYILTGDTVPNKDVYFRIVSTSQEPLTVET